MQTLKPRLQVLRPAVKTSAVRERMRGSQWMKRRARVLRRDPLCRCCSTAAHPVPSTEVDHKVPISRGGSDEDDNLQGLCGDCHAVKTAGEARSASGRG